MGGKHDAQIIASIAAHDPSKRPAKAVSAAETANSWVTAAAGDVVVGPFEGPQVDECRICTRNASARVRKTSVFDGAQGG